MDFGAIPLEILAGTTALVFFAIYLRLRGRVALWQMWALIGLAFAIGGGYLLAVWNGASGGQVI